MPFTCSICSEESLRICARCTKDSCDNHLCEKCRRCSDCCECEVTLADTPRESVRPVVRAMMAEVAIEVADLSDLDDLDDLDVDDSAELEVAPELEAAQLPETAPELEDAALPEEREPAEPQPTNGHPADEPHPEPEPEPTAASRPLSEL
jgi:hypothetical protein